jgi:hypothetical protein
MSSTRRSVTPVAGVERAGKAGHSAIEAAEEARELPINERDKIAADLM